MYDEKIDGNVETRIPYVIKRSGARVPFNRMKIVKAVTGANNDCGVESDRLEVVKVQAIADGIEHDAWRAGRDLSVEEIQDRVEDALISAGKPKVAKAFILYRYRHAENRKMTDIDKRIESVIKRNNEEVNQENSNKNPTVLSTQRDYMAGEWDRYYVRNFILPDDIMRAHDEGIIHVHDTDYIGMSETNCCLINLKDMLENGTAISGTHIDPPKSFATACTVMSQISAAVASSQYGGQTMSLAHLAPFVDVSRQKLKKRFAAELPMLTKEQLDSFVEKEVIKEVEAGCQTIQYQEITLSSTNGQAPFITLFMYLDEVPEGQTRDDLALIIKVMLEQRMKGVKDRTGHYVTPAFPKLIYALDEDNIHEGSKYYYLTKLAAECTAKRMVPDYISAKIMRELKGDVYCCMGCRSFLTPDNPSQPEGNCNAGNIAHAGDYFPGQHKYYGRFNQGVVTINLVDVACSAVQEAERNGTDKFDVFWKLFDERLELCHKALQIRHNTLLGTPSDVAPILWQDGALARLKPGETIDKLLYGNYSTISLGYAGLYEACVEMTGKSHTDPSVQPFALKVMQVMNDKCTAWRAAENISYSLYGTPLESTTYKFAKCLQRRFGKIKDVTDHNYITNSYHVNVREPINAFDKLTLEAEFQQLSPGGAVSYVEVPNMQNNIQAVLALMKHIYNTIMYAELNTKSDYCDKCGYDGEIQIVKDNTGKLIWKCPNCGCTDQRFLHVARRTCGYIGTQFWNQGRTEELAERVLHL